MPFTKRISIERYKQPADGIGGLIEGETDSGQRWVMYVDEQGRPDVYWPNRDETGAVIGSGIKLVDTGMEDTVRDFLKLDLSASETLVSTFPVFTPEVWPRKPGDSPVDYIGLQRGVVFCVAQDGENRADAMRRFVRELNEFYDAEEVYNGK